MKRLKIKFNATDIALLAIIAIVLLGLIFKYTEKDKTIKFSDDGRNELYISVKSEPMKKEYSERFSAGLPISDASSGERIGYISDYKVYSVPKTEAEMLSQNSEDMCRVSVIIACTAISRHDFYTVNGKRILIGDENDYIIPNLYFKGRCEYFSADSIGAEGNIVSK